MKKYSLDSVQAVSDGDGRKVVALFKEECITETQPREGSERALELFHAYVQWSTERGFPVLSFWRWSQHFSRLIPRAANRQQGTRYRCRNDYGGVALVDVVTELPVPIERLTEQWAREQGIWIIDESPGWETMSPQWVKSIQLEGRLQAPPLHLALLGVTKVGDIGKTITIPNGAPAQEVIVDALKRFGVEVTIVGAPSADTKKQRTA